MSKPTTSDDINGDVDKQLKMEMVEVEEVPKCGWCCWRPGCLQRCYKWPLGVSIMMWFGFIQGFVIHGITPVNSDTLERRFKLTSTEIGWFNSAIELAGACTSILLSYLADRKHRPRWMMVSALFFCVGSIVNAIPHFLAEPYDGNVSEEDKTCQMNPTPSNATGDTCNGSLEVSSWYGVLVAGNIITGVGAGIIFTVGMAFVDDFSDSKTAPFRMGLIYLCVAIGAAVGFGGGSAILQLDVNFNRPDWPQFRGKKDFNPKYCGAWWFGYVLGAIGFASVAFVFSCFDHELPETAQLRAQRVTETHEVKVTLGGSVETHPKWKKAFLNFCQSFLRLLGNPVLICITLAYITHGLFADGVQPFLIKILRTQFVMNETKVGLALAVLIVVAIGSGSILSGILLRKGDFCLRSLILIVFTFTSIATFLSFGFLLHCPQERISGVSVNYGTFDYMQPIPTFKETNLQAQCNTKCQCNTNEYVPVCQNKIGLQFFSPCHAGCHMETTTMHNGRNLTVYVNCDCLLPLFFEQTNMTREQQARFTGLLEMSQKLGPNAPIPSNPQVTQLRDSYRNFSKEYALVAGVCDTSCPKFYGAAVIFFFILFCGYFVSVPLVNICMRCVHEKDRAMALAFFNSAERFLGAIPGPLMVGSLIDRVCIFREPASDCGGRDGACQSYDVPELSKWLVGVFFGLHVIAISSYIVAIFLYKPPNGQTVKEFFFGLFSKHQPKKGSKTTTDNVDNGPTQIHENEAYIPDQPDN